ncbi:MAG: hypothetical protein WD489_05270 [Rhodovibrionaceae bacterium]
MPYAGICQLEQQEWREDRIDCNPCNGARDKEPGEQPQRMPPNTTDAQI